MRSSLRIYPGSLLFLIYINDFPCCLNHSTPRIFADDSSMTTSGKNIKYTLQAANSDLHCVKEWLLANKLSLNVTKTEHMFIGSDDNLKKIRDVPHLYLGDTSIKRVQSSKSLGVFIDERLSWGANTDYISKRVSSAIRGLRQVRSLVPLTTALIIYNSLIQPIFDYCDVVWDDLPITSAQRLQKLQNRAARVITQQGFDIRSNELRNMLGWDNLEQRRHKHKAIMIHKT